MPSGSRTTAGVRRLGPARGCGLGRGLGGFHGGVSKVGHWVTGSNLSGDVKLQIKGTFRESATRPSGWFLRAVTSWVRSLRFVIATTHRIEFVSQNIKTTHVLSVTFATFKAASRGGSLQKGGGWMHGLPVASSDCCRERHSL